VKFNIIFKINYSFTNF